MKPGGDVELCQPEAHHLGERIVLARHRPDHEFPPLWHEPGSELALTIYDDTHDQRDVGPSSPPTRAAGRLGL